MNERPAIIFRSSLWYLSLAMLILLGLQHMRSGFLAFAEARDVPNKVITDGGRRWTEEQYVLNRQNPYDVAFASFGTPFPQAVDRNAAIQPELGVPEGTVYPPWEYISGAPFFAVPKPWFKLTYSTWMVLGIIILMGWAWNECQAVAGTTLTDGLFASAAVLASSAVGLSVSYAQYGLLVVPALVSILVVYRRNEKWVLGLLLGFALLKPTTAIPFWLAMAFRKQWSAVTIAVLMLVVESLICWWLTHTNPIAMLVQMFVASRQFAHLGLGPVQTLIRGGMNPSVATPIVAAAVSILAFPALWLTRDYSLLASFSVASIYSRLWSYHAHYDDVVLLLPLIAILQTALRTRAWRPWSMFVLFGITLWLPAYYGAQPIVVALETPIWVAAAVFICINEQYRSRSTLLHSSEQSDHENNYQDGLLPTYKIGG